MVKKSVLIIYFLLSINFNTTSLFSQQLTIPDVYTVKEGDTLWSICTKFMGDPQYWPKLWEMNQFILNPHLIYPGSIIYFRKGENSESVQIEIKNELLDDSDNVEEDTKIVEASLNISEDIRVTPIEKAKDKWEGLEIKKKKRVDKQVMQIKLNLFLSENEVSPLGEIMYSESNSVLLTKNTIVYVSFKNASNISPGDQFMIYHLVKEVRDPDSYFTILCYHYSIIGTIKIINTRGEFFTAQITEVNEEIQRGDFIGNLALYSKIRNIKTRQSDFFHHGRVVGASSEKSILGEKDLIFVDVGKKHNVKIGDKYSVISWGELTEREGENMPEIIKAELALVALYKDISIGIILESKNTVEIGNEIKTTGIFRQTTKR